MEKSARIFIAEPESMIGSALVRRLASLGFDNLISRSSPGLDLTDQQQVYDYFSTERPDYVFLASARVGGILANSRFPAEFIYTNLQVQTNVTGLSNELATLTAPLTAPVPTAPSPSPRMAALPSTRYRLSTTAWPATRLAP